MAQGKVPGKVAVTAIIQAAFPELVQLLVVFFIIFMFH